MDQFSLPWSTNPEILILSTSQLDLFHNLNSRNIVEATEGQEGYIFDLVHRADAVLVLNYSVGGL